MFVYRVTCFSPPLTKRQIHLVLPSLTDLRNIVSRLSHIADDVTISANKVSHNPDIKRSLTTPGIGRDDGDVCQGQARAGELDDYVARATYPAIDRCVTSFGADCPLTERELADPEAEADPPPKDKMFSTLVSIRGLLKFLTSHLVGGVTIACELPVGVLCHAEAW